MKIVRRALSHSLLRPRIVEDQICMVWTEIVECAHHWNYTLPSADLLTAFGIFIVVHLVRPFEIVLFSDSVLQNRYFPMTYQFWLLAS